LGGNDWFNNSAYQNEVNFSMVNRESPQVDNIWVNGYDHVLKNNLSYKPRSSDTAYINTTQNTLSHNSFDLGINITDEDFVSLDQSQLTIPRKADGSLPDIDFMRPAPGSNLIDAGVDIGFYFLGNAPELGAIEVNYATDVRNIEGSKPEKISLFHNYPNPFNPMTNIIYEAPNSSNVEITIYDSIGRKIKTLVNEMRNSGTYEVRFEGSNLTSGIYFYRLQMNGNSIIKKMILLR